MSLSVHVRTVLLCVRKSAACGFHPSRDQLDPILYPFFSLECDANVIGTDHLCARNETLNMPESGTRGIVRMP